MISLRDYQRDCVDAVLSSKERGITRPLVSLATGLGKTLVFSALAKELDSRTLIVAHRDELIRQAKEKLLLIWPGAAPHIGIVKGDQHEPSKQIVIASIQSASRDRRLIDLQSAGFDLCIIDEAHHAAAPTYERLVRELGFLQDDPEKLLLGVTATPKRGDGSGLSSIFQEIVFDRSIRWGIRNGYLSPLVGRRISTRVSLQDVESQGGDFVASQLASAINVPGRNKLVIESFIEYANDRKKVLAFCADIQHAVDLADLFAGAGIPSAAIHGKLEIEERRTVLQSFADGKIRVLTNCGVLTEGFDAPQVDAILLCRPTQSQALYIQCVGRGTRLSPGKTNCMVIDFVDSSRLGLCNYKTSLEGVVVEEGDEERREETPPPAIRSSESVDGDFETSDVQEIDFFGRSQFAWIQIGDAWNLPISENREIWVRKGATGYRALLHEAGKTYNLSDQDLSIDYAFGTAEDWLRLHTTSALVRKDAKWRVAPPSEKQLAWLEQFGIRDPNLTKGEASDLLRIKFQEKHGGVRQVS